MNDKNKRGFLRSYRDTILSTLFLLGAGVYPHIAMHLNPPSAFEQTEIIRGVIVKAQRESSHILLELPDGRIQPLDFPGDLQGAYVGIWPTFSGASTQEFLTLKGCAADIRVDHLRWLVIPTNPRIWDLRCERLSIPYEKITKHYYRGINHPIVNFVGFLMLVSALALVLRNDIKQRKT